MAFHNRITEYLTEEKPAPSAMQQLREGGRLDEYFAKLDTQGKKVNVEREEAREQLQQTMDQEQGDKLWEGWTRLDIET